VFVYAKTNDRKYGECCQRLIKRVYEGKLSAIIDSVILLEVANALRKLGIKDVEDVILAIDKEGLRRKAERDHRFCDSVRSGKRFKKTRNKRCGRCNFGHTIATNKSGGDNTSYQKFQSFAIRFLALYSF